MDRQTTVTLALLVISAVVLYVVVQRWDRSTDERETQRERDASRTREVEDLQARMAMLEAGGESPPETGRTFYGQGFRIDVPPSIVVEPKMGPQPQYEVWQWSDWPTSFMQVMKLMPGALPIEPSAAVRAAFGDDTEGISARRVILPASPAYLFHITGGRPQEYRFVLERRWELRFQGVTYEDAMAAASSFRILPHVAR